MEMSHENRQVVLSQSANGYVDLRDVHNLTTMIRDEVVDLMQSGKIQLRPSQKGISYPIVERIYKKMKADIQFASIQVAHRSVIVNGHHRYLASLLAGIEMDMVECPLTSAKRITTWESIELFDQDWDTVERIDRLNGQDAQFNGMTLEELMNLIA